MILSALFHAGFFDILRYLQKNRVTILMYHRFSEEQEPFKISRKIFERQIKFLINRYNFISLKHYSDFLHGRLPNLPDNPVIITIDDGFLDNYTVAYPLLKKYSVPATIFITTDFVDNQSWLWFNKLKYILNNSNVQRFEFRVGFKKKEFFFDSSKNKRNTKLQIFDHCKKIHPSEIDTLLHRLAKSLNVHVPENSAADFLPLSWNQIKEMQRNKIEFGSHTCTHPILSNLNEKELIQEISLSKKIIESNLSTEVSSFCYPVGTPEDITDYAVKTVQNAGYSCAVTTSYGFNKLNGINAFLLKRIGISHDSSVLLSKEFTHR